MLATSWPTSWEFSPRWKTYVANLQPWKNLMSKNRFIAGIYIDAFQIQYRVLNQHPKWRTTPSVHKTPAFAIYIHHIYVKFLYKEEFCEVSEGFSTTYLFCFQPQVCQSYQPFNLGASKRWRDSASSWWLITMNLLILSPTLMVRAMMNLIVRIFFSNYTWSMFPFSVVHFQTHDYPSSPQESQ